MIEVTLYSRPGCHLCDDAIAELEDLQEEIPHKLIVVDIDGNGKLEQSFGMEIPVVQVGPYTLKAPFGRQELVMTLNAARDRERHIESVENAAFGEGTVVWTKADSFTHWFSRHYLAVLNLLVLLYVGLPFLAPVLMKAGAEAPARMIYRGYSFACHQLAFRSFFLFGEQPAYPRDAAQVDSLIPFGTATGLSEADTQEALFAARNFVGNDAVGYKIALCERDVAIYGAILLFGLLYAVTGRNWPKLPWYLWLLIGLVPIGFDGVSQLLSQPPFNFWDYRESTPLLRTLTGFLFGFSTAWFGYPLVEESMADAREIMNSKLNRVRRARAEAETI